MSFEPSFALGDSYLEPDIVTDEAYVGYHAWASKRRIGVVAFYCLQSADITCRRRPRILVIVIMVMIMHRTGTHKLPSLLVKFM